MFSYEGPFGVGYLVAELAPQVEQQGPGLLKGLRGKQQQAVGDRRAGESVYVRLARQSLETYVRTGQKMPLPADIPPELVEPAGAFVTLKKKGQLRGCIGTILPTQKNLAAEIRDNAVSAGSRDPRFWPVAEEELKDIVYSVDVLAPPEAVERLAQLDPKRYGVIAVSYTHLDVYKRQRYFCFADPKAQPAPGPGSPSHSNNRCGRGRSHSWANRSAGRHQVA